MPLPYVYSFAPYLFFNQTFSILSILLKQGDTNFHSFDEVISKGNCFSNVYILYELFWGEIAYMYTLPAFVLYSWCIFKKLNIWTLGSKNMNYLDICLLIYLNILQLMHQGLFGLYSITQNNSKFIFLKLIHWVFSSRTAF